MGEKAIRQEIIDNCLRMNALGLNQGTAGNISVRFGDGLLVTPSGIPYDQMVPEDIVYMDWQGGHDKNQLPSSEWRFHRDILRAKPEAGAVVHNHAMYAATIAILGRDIPAIHYMVAAGGGNTIRCAPYATYGTQALSDNAVAALEGRTCCLLANHGMIATGATLEKAMWLAVEVEALAHQYFNVLPLGGGVVLPDDEIAVVLEKFKSYGIRPKE